MHEFRMFVVAAGIAVVVAACQQDPRLVSGSYAGRQLIADQLDAHLAAIARHEARLADLERRLAACEGK